MRTFLRDDPADSSCKQIWCYNGLTPQWVATVKSGVAKIVLAALKEEGELLTLVRQIALSDAPEGNTHAIGTKTKARRTLERLGLLGGDL